MRLGVFATGPVGRRVADVLRGAGVTPACVVYDEADPAAGDIAGALGVADGTVLLANTAVVGGEGAERLADLDLDLGLLAWWPYLIKQEVIDTARLGYLNFHPSLLPYGRGKDPNFWAIVEGTPFGVTLHFVDPGIDTGPIAFQRELPVRWEDTGATLYQRAQDAIVELFQASLPRILSGDIPRVPQHEDGATSHLRKHLEPASVIDLEGTYRARDLLDLLRARTFPPHPGARFVADDGVYEVRLEIRRAVDADAGST